MINKIIGVNGSINGWPDGHTYLIGLMTYPIRHSMSPTVYNNVLVELGLNFTYPCFETDNKRLPKTVEAIRTLDMRGSDISMPNKKEVIKCLDKLSPVSKMCDAVNTVVNDNGILTDYTTDGIGPTKSSEDEGIDIRGKKIYLAGAGGAATPIAVQAALGGVSEIEIFNLNDDKQFQAEKSVKTINEKTNCKASLHHSENKDDFKHAISERDIYRDVIGVGMKPLEDMTLVEDPSWLHEDMTIFDTVYAPKTIKLMKAAQKAGVKHVLNGIGVITEQGAAVSKLRAGEDMPTDYTR